MKSSSKKLNIVITVGILITILPTASLSAEPFLFPGLAADLTHDAQFQLRNPFQPPPNPWKPVQVQWPENYIDPTLKFGMNLVLPEAVRNGLNVDAGYNRSEGLPTLKAEYFLPIKAWNDKSIFMAPRVSLDSKTEGFSMGCGFRHLIKWELLVGFHAFHDWVRPRGQNREFVKQAGIGFELSALPIKGADVSLTMNAYIPVNERLSLAYDGNTLVEERLPVGLDAKLTCILPPLVEWLDLKLEARLHTYRGAKIDLNGHNATFSANTRDGLLGISISEEKDTFTNEDYKIQGNVNLVFDWADLLKGRLPFSAPYKMSSFRYERKIRDGLYERVVRRHDLPTDRSEKRLGLVARVSDRSVQFDGGFPDLPHARLTVQVSQSPWRDAGEVTTDATGAYSGKVDLKPGEYKFRLIHKPTGKVSAEKLLTVQEKTTKK